MAIMYSKHVRSRPSTITYSFRLVVKGPGFGLLANADLQFSCSDLLYTGALPISILHVSSHNIFLALQSLAPLSVAYTGVLKLSSHVEFQYLRLLRLAKPALVLDYQLN